MTDTAASVARVLSFRREAAALLSAFHVLLGASAATGLLFFCARAALTSGLELALTFMTE